MKEQITFEKKMHHYMGIEMNIQTWNLLDKSERTPQDDARMVYFAHASLYHWKLSPEFKPVNEQRGEWMISRVYVVLGKGDQALKHAQKCLSLTKKYDLKDFDLAFAYEAMARAYSLLNDKENGQKYYDLVIKAGEEIEKKEDKKIFQDDLNAEPWFGVIKH